MRDEGEEDETSRKKTLEGRGEASDVRLGESVELDRHAGLQGIELEEREKTGASGKS